MTGVYNLGTLSQVRNSTEIQIPAVRGCGVKVRHKCLQAWRGRARRSQGHKAPSGDGDNDMRKAIDLARKSALLVLRDYFSFARNSSAIRKRAPHGLEEHTVCENAIYHQLKGGKERQSMP
jgi:hypothetical protein